MEEISEKLSNNDNIELNKLSFVNKISKKNKDQERFDSLSFKIHTGEFHSSTLLTLNLYTGEDANYYWQSVLFNDNFDVSIQNVDSSPIMILLKIRSNGNAVVAKSKFQELIDSLLEIIKIIIPDSEEILNCCIFEYKAQNEHIILQIKCKYDLLNEILKILSQIVDINVKDQYIAALSFEFGLKTNPRDMLEEVYSKSFKTILEKLLSGFKVEFKAKMISSTLKSLRKSLFKFYSSKKYKMPESLKETYFFILLQQFDFDLQLNLFETEKLEKIFKTIGVDLGIISEVFQIIKEARILELIQQNQLFYKIFTFFLKYTESNIELIVKMPKAVLSLRFQTDGIKEFIEYFMY